MVGRLWRGVNFSHERILAALSIPPLLYWIFIFVGLLK